MINIDNKRSTLFFEAGLHYIYIWPQVASDSLPSCLSLPYADVIGVYHHTNILSPDGELKSLQMNKPTKPQAEQVERREQCETRPGLSTLGYVNCPTISPWARAHMHSSRLGLWRLPEYGACRSVSAVCSYTLSNVQYSHWLIHRSIEEEDKTPTIVSVSFRWNTVARVVPCLCLRKFVEGDRRENEGWVCRRAREPGGQMHKDQGNQRGRSISHVA